MKAFADDRINSVLNVKIWDSTKLKAFADDKMKVVQMMISICNGVVNILVKGENAGYQHFPFFPQFFQKSYLLRSLKLEVVC